MRIQHNIMAMNAYRNYNNNTSALSSNLEKLSSGYKINRAGDDAAGLAISEKMRAQISGLDQAESNVKDGISLVKTGEGALQEVQDMLNRMVTLATQSANGTYDDDVDRDNLQKEVDQLTAEIDRIADSANFNGIKLLDGSLTDGNVVASYNSVSSADIQKLMLKQSATNDISDVGSKTILETDAADAKTPSFSVELNGVKHVVTDNSGTLTLTIDGIDITLSEDDLGSKGDEISSEDLVNGFLEHGTSNNLSSGVFTDNDGTDWNVTADGTKLTFTLADLNDIGTDYPYNKHFDVSMTGVDETSATAIADVYKGEVGYTQATTGADKGSATATVNYIDENGDEQSVDVTFDVQTSASKTNSNLAAAINADDTLKALFNAKADSNKATFSITSQKAGATVKVTGITINNADATKDTASLADETVSSTEGKDVYTQGTNGYTNAATTVDIAVDKKTGDVLASTTLDLSGKLTDGAKITLGDQTYTIALGADSTFKDVENAVYVANPYKTDGKTLDEELIASKLAEVAANNTTFSVGHVNGSNAKITLKQLQEVKDTTDMSTMEKFASYIGISSLDTEEADPVLGSALTLQIGDTSDSYNQLSVSIKDMHSAALGIADIDISTQEGASKAIDIIKTAINTVSSTRGTLGATQNRLEHTSNNLSVMSENIQDAESTIRDTDIAEEMMSYTKNNILVQSAQAMLAQANSVPQGVLQLLQ